MGLPCCLWVTLSFAETKIYLPRLLDLRLVQNTNIRSAEINRIAQQSVTGHARGRAVIENEARLYESAW